MIKANVAQANVLKWWEKNKKDIQQKILFARDQGLKHVHLEWAELFGRRLGNLNEQYLRFKCLNIKLKEEGYHVEFHRKLNSDDLIVRISW